MDEPDIPNTKRFWRLNEIEALKIMLQFRDKTTAQDPEEHAAIIKNQTQLDALRAKESGLQARFERITGRNLAQEAADHKAKSALPPLDWQAHPTEDLDLPF